MAETISLAIDAMGGDHGLQVTVVAALLALRATPKLKLLLVGDEPAIGKALAAAHAGDAMARIEIAHASEVVAMDESPSKALRYKKDSSMRVAINAAREGRVQGVVSAGNTGALMATAKFVLKTLPGIDRPAICAPMPSSKGRPYMLDLGANAECTPEQLVQFAVMGSALVTALHEVPKPRVALLNIGEEEIKGNDAIKAAALGLKKSGLNYTGYIEGDGIFRGEADVVVCDGFIGNIALKTGEGVAKLVRDFMKAEFLATPFSKIAALIAKPVLTRLAARIDPRNYNGAALLGLNGLVIKSHGGADAASFANAIAVAINAVEHDLIGRTRGLIAAAAVPR
ncbi:MAG: phosphate acyltransferase PlsX [Pseudomonadota bacterium]